jgi:hypothetical protein
VLQHTLFTRAHPTPEQVSTLVARLGALMGPDRFGAPATVDSYRPGAFVMTAFATEHNTSNRGRLRAGGASARLAEARGEERRAEAGARMVRQAHHERPLIPSPSSLDPARDDPEALEGSKDADSAESLTSALRRYRQPVPARVAVADGRPVRVTTDRRGFSGGMVTRCAGPWRTSGEWWTGAAGRAGEAGRENSVSATHQPYPPRQPHPTSWNRDEWDVSLSDGAVYRIFQDRASEAWFVDAIVD